MNTATLTKQASSLVGKVRGEMGMALLRTFTARGIAAVGSFALVVVLGRLYGTTGVGVFALAQSLIMAIAILGRYGMDNAVMRFVGRDVHSPHVFAYLRYACIKALVLSTIGAVALFFTRYLWAQFFHAPELAPVLVGIAISAPAFTLAFICSGFMKAVRKPATGLLLQNGAIAFVAAALVVLLQAIALPHLALINIGIAYGIAAWLVVGSGLWSCWRWFRTQYQGQHESLEGSSIREFNQSSSAFFASGIAQFMISVVGIWIAGYFLSTSELGLFKAAQQVTNLIRMILLVINAVYPPRFATAFHKNKRHKLNNMARQSTLLGLSLAIVPVLVCFTIPHWVLGLINTNFAAAAAALYILAAAQLVNIGCGPTGFLLNMTGHEQLVRNIAWLSNIAGVVAILMLTPVFGVNGTACGVGLAIVMRKLSSVYFIWRRLSIWLLPLPNVLKYAGVTADTKKTFSAN